MQRIEHLFGIILTVAQPSDSLRRRLVGVAAALDLPGLGPRVDEVISLALDLVVAGQDTPATVTVASLGTGATLRDSGEDIARMLQEQGAAAPEPLPGTDSAYTTALWAVACDGITVGEFSGVFYRYLPAWDEQDASQKELVVLLHEWEQECDVASRQPISEKIKLAAARAVGLSPT